MIRTFIFIALLLFSFQGNTQNWFSEIDLGNKNPGYVIGIAGDTIKGYIQYDYPIVMQKRVAFYDNTNGNKAIYQPEDIRGYGIGKTYWASISVRINTYNGIYVFQRFGILESDSGPVTLYRIFEEMDKKKKRINSNEAESLFDKISFYREKQSLDHLYIKKLEKPAEKVMAKSFRKSFPEKMNMYIRDHSVLLEKIKAKDLKLEDIDQIVTEYNNWYSSKFKK